MKVTWDVTFDMKTTLLERGGKIHFNDVAFLVNKDVLKRKRLGKGLLVCSFFSHSFLIISHGQSSLMGQTF
jgi:hypothetical protein